MAFHIHMALKVWQEIRKSNFGKSVCNKRLCQNFIFLKNYFFCKCFTVDTVQNLLSKKFNRRIFCFVLETRFIRNQLTYKVGRKKNRMIKSILTFAWNINCNICLQSYCFIDTHFYKGLWQNALWSGGIRIIFNFEDNTSKERKPLSN